MAGPNLEMRRNRVLADLARDLTRLDLPAFTREVARRIREVLDVEICQVVEFLVDEDRSPLRTDVSKIPSELSCGWAALSRGRGLVSAVIQARGRSFGILNAYSTSRRCYAEEEVAFLQDIAKLLGVASERARSEENYLRAVERERQRADAAEERFAFLREANMVLAAVPIGSAALAAAAHLAVPVLADWCFVDLIEEDGASLGTIRRLAVARSEGGAVRELNCRYPLDPNAPHGTPKVLRTGKPELMPEVHDALLRSLIGDGDHLESSRGPAPSSYLCVPLQVGRRLVGSMGFVSSGRGESIRRYRPEDLTLAESLARCTAFVVASTLEGTRGPEQRVGEPASSRRNTIASPGREPGLTPRQLEVLQLLDSGMRAHQIKAELNLSEPTVRTHIRAILRAFGARSQLEALHKARALGFIEEASRDAGNHRSW